MKRNAVWHYTAATSKHCALRKTVDYAPDRQALFDHGRTGFASVSTLFNPRHHVVRFGGVGLRLREQHTRLRSQVR